MTENYLKDGYFDEKGYIRKNLLFKTAIIKGKEIAKGRTHNNQIRNFFGYVRRAERVFDETKDKERFIRTILKIPSMSAYKFSNSSNSNGNIDKYFYQFLEDNINSCKTAKDIKEGFIPHFETVIGFYSLFKSKKR